MLLTMLKAKLHCATVTGADLHYEGSIGIDRDLLDASGMLPHEQVDVLNISTGGRFTTYVIEAPRGSREICGRSTGTTHNVDVFATASRARAWAGPPPNTHRYTWCLPSRDAVKRRRCRR